MSVPECFWIMGNKCHPDGSIVPDEYKKNGTLYIHKQDYETLTKECEALADALRQTIDEIDRDYKFVGVTAAEALNRYDKYKETK